MNRKNIIIISVISLLVIGLFVAGLMLQKKENEEIVEESPEVVLYLFWSETCPFCLAEKEFLTSIQPEYPSLTIEFHEVSQSQENYLLFLEMASAYGVENPQGVPMTFISDEYFVGFAVDPVGNQIVQKIEECLENACPNPISFLSEDSDEDLSN